MNVEKLKNEINRRLELNEVINPNFVRYLSAANPRPVLGTKLTRLKGRINGLFSRNQ